MFDNELHERSRKLVANEVFCNVGGLVTKIQEAYNDSSYFEWEAYAFTCEPTDE